MIELCRSRLRWRPILNEGGVGSGMTRCVDATAHDSFSVLLCEGVLVRRSTARQITEPSFRVAARRWQGSSADGFCVLRELTVAALGARRGAHLFWVRQRREAELCPTGWQNHRQAQSPPSPMLNQAQTGAILAHGPTLHQPPDPVSNAFWQAAHGDRGIRVCARPGDGRTNAPLERRRRLVRRS